MKISFIFQLVTASVAFSFFISSWIKFFRRERRQTIFKLIASSFVWIFIALFTIFPKLTHTFSENLGFGESLNTFIFIGFIVVFIILFKIINIIERIEKNISEIIRKEALDYIEKK